MNARGARRLGWWLAWTTSVVARSAWALTYSITDLGDLGGDYSAGYAIGANGQVVGEARTAARETHAFLYSSGMMADLGVPDQFSTARGINATGEVVGWAGPISYERPFLYSAGQVSDLGPMVGGVAGIAVGINDNGLVVGTSFDDFSDDACHPPLGRIKSRTCRRSRRSP